MTKRLLSMLLAILMVVGMLPVTGSALEPQHVYSGSVPISDIQVGDVILKNTVIEGTYYLNTQRNTNFRADINYFVSNFRSPDFYDIEPCYVITLVDPLNSNYSATIYRSGSGNCEAILPLPDLEREGYSFDGWWTAKTGGFKVIDGSRPNVVFSNNYTSSLYARWVSTAYQITTATEGNGSLTVSSNASEPGQTITVTAAPNNGYQLESIKVYKTDDSSLVADITSSNSFTMPGHDVTVKAKFVANSIPIAYFTFTKSSLVLKRTETATLTPFTYALPENHTDTLIWSSTDNNIATVDENGNVTAISAGTAHIRATSFLNNSKSGTLMVIVEPLNDSKFFYKGTSDFGTFLVNGKTGNFEIELGTTVTVTPQPRSGFEVDQVYYCLGGWGGPRTDINKNEDGLYVFTMPNGNPYINVDFKRAETAAVTGVSLNKTSTTLTVDNNETLIATVEPGNATNKTVTWRSSNDSVATVDATGKVTAVGAGTATITVTTVDGSKTATCTVTVTAAAVDPSTEITKAPTQNGSFEATYNPENKTVTVTPAPAEDYEVDKVTYTPAGGTETEVTPVNGVYSFSKPDGEITVKVLFKEKAPATVAVENVSLDKTSTTLTVGGTETLTATVTPDNATNKNVSWTSSNTEVATVDETGKVTAVGAGNANIIVTTVDGSKTATCAVTVTAAAVDPSTEITKAQTENGNFDVSCEEQNGKVMVTVTPAPAEGYEVDKVTYTPEGSTPTDVNKNTEDKYTFEKPDGKLTVNVTFKQTAPAGHTHSVNGSDGDQEWIPIQSLDDIKDAGHYCLEDNVSYSGKWQPISGTVLCLNGHSIVFKDSGFVNLSSKTFTLTDCAPNGDVGNITGGNAAFNKGGGVYIGGNATFTMYGGTITGNTASGGAGVYVLNSSSKFNLYGGKIAGNAYGSAGGDVYLGSGAKMEVAGSPIIGRVYLTSPDEIPIVIGAGGLHNGASITVSTVGGQESANVAAANNTDYSTYFHSWNDTYDVSYDADKVIRLAKVAPLTVKFIIEQNGNFKEVQVAKNATLTAPTLAEVNGAEMPGYTLEGWYKDRYTFENAWDFATDTATQNLILYAKLKLNPATIQCAGNYTGIYDGQNHPISVTASHNAYTNMPKYFTYQWYKGETPETATVIDGANASTYSVKNAADSGTYYCKVTASDAKFVQSSENLALTSEAWSDPITVTISKQEVTPPTIESKVFNESTQTAVVPTSDLYTVTQNDGGINAGSYDVILTLTDSANYTWPNFDTADYEMQFVIEPADQAALAITDLPATAAYEDTFKLTTSGGSGDGSVSWAVTNGPATVDAATGDVTITGVGSITIQATKAGSQNYNEATATVTFTSVKAKQEKPNSLTPTQETIAGKQDGKISGVNSNMEFKLKGAESYIPIGNVTVLENLPSGTYLIRFKADENHEASEDVEITVQQGKMLTVTLPTVQTGYTLAVKDNGSNEVTYRGSIVLTYELAEGYTEGTDFAVNATYGTVTANQDGTYTISGIEQDTTVSVTGVRDITAPTAEIAITTNKWTEFLNTITFDLFFKQTQTVTINAQDAGSGVKTIEYYLSETEMTLDAVKAITAWEGYNDSFSIDAERNYVIYAKVTDKAENDGNTVYINSDGIVMDKTAPIFSGVTDGNEYYTTQKVTVTETNLASLTCNRTPVTLPITDPITLEGNKDITYEIVATDKAGNSSKITVVMNPVENLSVPLPEDTTLELDDKEEIEALKENVSSIWANNLSNITDEEEAALKAIIARCDALLQIIANVNNVNDQIKALKAPAEISPDEIDVILAYDDALEAYEKLTKRGKELVDTNELAKLEAVGKALTAYDVIKGHKSSYVKGSFKTISIVANGYYDVFGKYADGAFGKFREVRIDGEFLDPQYYTAASGSTVITLKTSYLESLKTGKHYIQFVYVDGSTDGNDYFRVSVNNGSPMTGDNSHILMFTGMAVTSLLCAAMLIVFFPRKKGKYER